MGQNLYWLPVVEKKGKSLPDALKFILREKYDLYFGQELTGCDLNYLEGLADAGVEGATELREIIIKHKHVKVYLE